MDKPMIVGLCGLAKVGKTTTARFVTHLLNETSVVLSFATPVKDIALLFGWDGQKDQRGRKLLQQIGTDVGRTYDPDIWVNKLVDRAINHIRRGSFVVVDDVRFQNEIDAIRSMGGLVVLLDPGKRKLDYSGEPHESEQPYSLSVDHVVVTDKSPQEVAFDVVDFILGRSNK